MTIQEFSLQLSEYRKQKKSNDGLSFFKQNKHLFSAKDIKNDSYIIFNMIYFLKETNKCKYVFQFLSQYSINILNLNKPVATSLSWCLLKKDFEFDVKKHLIIFKDLIPVLEKYEEKLAISLLLKKGIQFAENSKQLDNKNMFLIEFLSIFNPYFLMEDKKYLSSKEYYYLKLSKVYREIKKYEKSISIAEEGLRKIQYFHKNTDIWLKRDIALCKIELNELDESLMILEKLYEIKKDWFFLYDMAKIYYQKNQLKKVFDNLIYIMNLNIPIKSKLKSIFLLGEILEKQNSEFALKHFIFLALFYQKQGWNIRKNINEKLKNLDLNKYDYNELFSELKNFWENSDKSLICGKISKILHNNEKGIDGFIKADKDYYFSLPRKNKLSNLISVGVKVKFKVNNARAFIQNILEK
jgi:hypothetical protein